MLLPLWCNILFKSLCGNYEIYCALLLLTQHRTVVSTDFFLIFLFSLASETVIWFVQTLYCIKCVQFLLQKPCLDCMNVCINENKFISVQKLMASLNVFFNEYVSYFKNLYVSIWIIMSRAVNNSHNLSRYFTHRWGNLMLLCDNNNAYSSTFIHILY